MVEAKNLLNILTIHYEVVVVIASCIKLLRLLLFCGKATLEKYTILYVHIDLFLSYIYYSYASDTNE